MKTIGVIGLGSIGMRHAKNLTAMGHCVVGYDPIEERRKLFNGGALTEEAYVIASPTDCHLSDVISTGVSGKATFVEKPIFHSLAYTPRTSHILMVGYNLRFHSCVKKAKEWLTEQDIGAPLWANFTLGQYSEKEPYLRDGVILNWSHEIDLCLYLLGEAQVRASATRVKNGKDDLADILFEHTNGCRSTVHLDYLTKPEIRQGIIVGTDGTIIFDLVNRHAWLRDNGGIIEHFEGQDSWNDNYIEEMQAFLDRIDRKETLGCTAGEALKVLDICLTARKQAGLS